MRFDLLSIVEATHDLEGDLPSWLQRVAERMLPSFDDGLGVQTWGLAPTDGALRFVGRSLAGGPPGFYEAIARGHDSFMRETAEASANPKTAFGASLRELVGEATLRRLVARDGLDRYGFEDNFGVTAFDADGHGVGIAVPRRSAEPLDARRIARARRIASHLLSGYRLRRAVGQVREAVLSPDGAMQHAEGPAATDRGRESLRSAVRAIEDSRGRLRRLDPDEALARWQALTAGRWTLVDSEERDGKRFLIACRNEPGAAAEGRLSAREQQVATLAAQGMAIKDMAYSLGLSTSTIGTHLGSVMRKLKARSRAELVMRLRASPR